VSFIEQRHVGTVLRKAVDAATFTVLSFNADPGEKRIRGVPGVDQLDTELVAAIADAAV